MDAGIVAFEDGPLGDVCDELQVLGAEFLEQILVHLQEVRTGQVDHRGLRPFCSYQGVEMFQAKIGAKFVVFAVELEKDGDLKISIMFAGQQGVRIAYGALSWDGHDYAALRQGIIKARATAWFH